DWLGFLGMLRPCSCIAFAVMLVSTAQAADTTLTLACKGTETSKIGSARKSSEVINIGIIVDLQKKTVTGLTDYPLTIESLTETTISFHGILAGWDNKSIEASTYGPLDRITGSLVAASGRHEPPTIELSYDLKCRPTQRMF